MIRRDGAYVSLWQDMPGYIPEPVSENSRHYDVVIAGGGITGITAGYLLQMSGKKCLILEAYTLGFGTTGGTTAHINTLLDTPYTTIIKNFSVNDARLVASAAREAIEFIKSNVQELKIDCGFEEVPAFLFAEDKKQAEELDDIYKACDQVGLNVRFAADLPVPIPFKKAIAVGSQAKFNPLHYIYALARQFEKSGGRILQNLPLKDATEKDNIVSLQTDKGEFTCSSLIYATHIPPGVNILHLRCAPWRSYAMAIKLTDDSYPEGLAYDMQDPYHYYRSQTIAGETYLIAGGEDHKTAHEENTEQCFRNLENHVRKYFPVQEVVYQWSSQYFEPVDGLPYIGKLPGGSENIYVATGYGGNGMTYSTIAAAILKDMILHHESLYKDLFSPSRIKPLAGFTDFIEHNADVVKQFVGKWFDVKDLDVLAGLAPGEGKVVKYDSQVIALSKDSEGQLHAVSPACTHLKCSVAWNLAEQTWDCPCHGSRFDPDGKVLTGPATRDLEIVELKTMSEQT
ncbi:MAG TPA: FAD-dependent oxidoreductase [Ohtaekwangia sp.]